MHNIYTDLDSILDTRHALLYHLDKGIAKEVIDTKYYRNRRRDGFNNISMDIFRCLYRHRQKELLSLTKPTHVCALISNLIITELKDLENDGEFNIYLNTYPYNLNLDEQNVLVSLIDIMVPEFVGIKIIYNAPDEISPEWIEESEIKTMYMYEALSWLEYHNANTNILSRPLTNTMLYGPDIIEGNIKDDMLSPEFFKNLMVMFSGIINYLPISIVYFNTTLDIDDKKRKV